MNHQPRGCGPSHELSSQFLAAARVALLPSAALALGLGWWLALAAGVLAQTPEPTSSIPQPPSQAIHCARPFENTTVPGLVAPGNFVVEVDSSRPMTRLTVPDLPPGTTCYTVMKYPSAGNPIKFAWDEVEVASPGTFTDGIGSAGRYCYDLIVGNATGHSAPLRRCVDVPASIAPTATATPTMPATPFPPGTGTRATQTPEPAPSLTPTPAAPEVGSGFDGRDAASRPAPFELVVAALAVASLGLLLMGHSQRRK